MTRCKLPLSYHPVLEFLGGPKPWGCSSAGEHLLCMHLGLNSVPLGLLTPAILDQLCALVPRFPYLLSAYYSRIVSYSQVRIAEEVSQIGGDGGGSAVHYLQTVAVRLPGVC